MHMQIHLCKNSNSTPRAQQKSHMSPVTCWRDRTTNRASPFLKSTLKPCRFSLHSPLTQTSVELRRLFVKSSSIQYLQRLPISYLQLVILLFFSAPICIKIGKCRMIWAFETLQLDTTRRWLTIVSRCMMVPYPRVCCRGHKKVMELPWCGVAS